MLVACFTDKNYLFGFTTLKITPLIFSLLQKIIDGTKTVMTGYCKHFRIFVFLLFANLERY
jgi:hypothetical protein